MSAPVFHHEIENKPLRAERGRLEIKGWCLAAGSPLPPAVRLTLNDREHFEIARRIARADVVRTFGAPAAAADCGFVFEVRVGPGAHAARLEASLDGEPWRLVKRFTLLATPDRLQVGIETPEPGRSIGHSVRVAGWCAHADYALAGVWLHYGTQRIRCESGLPRTDVPRYVPGSPDATKAGFISVKNLPVGRGTLRVKALAESGEALLADTGTNVDITVDEDHPRPFTLDDRRPGLGPACRAPDAGAPAPDENPLRVLFVLYGDFTSNSAIHVANLANQLARRGHRCTVTVPRNAETAAYLRSARFDATNHADELARAATRTYDVIHAWTTRENVRAFCQQMRALQPAARLLVHLEDNERHILELSLGRPIASLLELPAAELDALVPASLTHPRHSREFLDLADGATVIIDTLRTQVPDGKPTHTIWPAADAACYFSRPRPVEFRQALGWTDDHIALFYHGNVHPSNRTEMRELYAAVLALNRLGHACTLIRLGRDACDFLGDLEPQVAPHVMNLGLVEQHHHLPVLMSLADYFVQPGEADPFNDLRFPSKLPEFFALGRPVILPRTNLGRLVRHGEDAFVVDRADCAGIVAAILALQADPALRARLGAGAVAFAREHFDWASSAGRLHDFYRTSLAPA